MFWDFDLPSREVGTAVPVRPNWSKRCRGAVGHSGDAISAQNRRSRLHGHAQLRALSRDIVHHADPVVELHALEHPSRPSRKDAPNKPPHALSCLPEQEQRSTSRAVTPGDGRGRCRARSRSEVRRRLHQSLAQGNERRSLRHIGQTAVIEPRSLGAAPGTRRLLAAAVCQEGRSQRFERPLCVGTWQPLSRVRGRRCRRIVRAPVKVGFFATMAA